MYVNWRSEEKTYTGSFLRPSNRWKSSPVRLGAARNGAWWRRLLNGPARRAFLASTGGISARTPRVPELPGWRSAVEVFWWVVSPPHSSYPLERANVDFCRYILLALRLASLNSRCRCCLQCPWGSARRLPLAGRWKVALFLLLPPLQWTNSPPAFPATGHQELGRFRWAELSRSVPNCLSRNLTTVMCSKTSAAYEATKPAGGNRVRLATRSQRNCPLQT